MPTVRKKGKTGTIDHRIFPMPLKNWWSYFIVITKDNLNKSLNAKAENLLI